MAAISFQAPAPGQTLNPTAPRVALRNVWQTLSHRLLIEALANQSYISPILPESRAVYRVLDLGHHHREWLTAFEDRHRDAWVLITSVDDLLTAGGGSGPKRTGFLRSHLRSRPLFHFIHGRMLAADIGDLGQFVYHSLRALAPGGYLELWEVVQLTSGKGVMSPNQPLAQTLRLFSHLVQRAIAHYRNEGELRSQYLTAFRSGQFTNIVERSVVLPIGAWSSELDSVALGMRALTSVQACLRRLSYLAETRFFHDLGLTQRSFTELVANTTKAVKMKQLEPQLHV